MAAGTCASTELFMANFLAQAGKHPGHDVRIMMVACTTATGFPCSNPLAKLLLLCECHRFRAGTLRSWSVPQRYCSARVPDDAIQDGACDSSRAPEDNQALVSST